MALLSDLVANVAQTTATPAATVTVIARSLREAGLIVSAGRGLAAAHMQLPDAVSLLLGVASPSYSTKAAEAVDAIGALTLTQAVYPGPALRAMGVDVCQPLRESLLRLIPATGGLVALRVRLQGGRWSAGVEFAAADKVHTLDYVEPDPPWIERAGKIATVRLAADVVQALYRSLNAPAGRPTAEPVTA